MTIRFQALLTLYYEFFSTFPHGTCSLSDSCKYLALDGVYHLLWAVLPNNPTLDTIRVRRLTSDERPHTHYGIRAQSRELCHSVQRTTKVPNTASIIGHTAEILGAGLIPLHSQLLWESLLVSFPPLTDMLKFSGYSRLI